MSETEFKNRFFDKLDDQFPGCIRVPIDESQFRSFPDTLVLYGKNWAALEFKAERNSPRQPNQDYWVDVLEVWSFGRFVYPENCMEVLDELIWHLKSG
jgi:hypothetical protein